MLSGVKGIVKNVNQKRKRHIAFTIILAGGFLIVLGFTVIRRHVSERNYLAAIQMFENGQFEEAAEEFSKLSYYKDSLAYLLKIKITLENCNSDYMYALELRDNCQYQDAISVFENLGDFKDSEERIYEIKELEYLDAIKLFDEKNYEQAFIYFSNLEDYKDSKERAESSRQKMDENDINEVPYQEAYENYRLRNYRLAFDQFGKIQDYKDSANMMTMCLKAIHKNYHTISAGIQCSMGIKDNGDIMYTGNSPYSQKEASFWKDIVSISCFGTSAIGLKNDGTVVVASENNNIDVSEWKDIVAVSAGQNYVVGLRADGTVIGDGHDAGDGQLKVDEWENIVSIATGWRHTVGLAADGTVYITGYGSSLQLRQIEDHKTEWADIIAIAAGGGNNETAGKGHTVGLKSDGTVVAVGDNTYGQCNVSSWTNIVAIAAGDWHTVALRSDGTVLSTGSYNGTTCSTDDWTDIVAIAAGTGFTLGLNSDGTVLSVGYDKQNQRPNSEEWTDIRVYSGWDNVKEQVAEVSFADENFMP